MLLCFLYAKFIRSLPGSYRNLNLGTHLFVSEFYWQVFAHIKTMATPVMLKTLELNENFLRKGPHFKFYFEYNPLLGEI